MISTHFVWAAKKTIIIRSYCIFYLLSQIAAKFQSIYTFNPMFQYGKVITIAWSIIFGAAIFTSDSDFIPKL